MNLREQLLEHGIRLKKYTPGGNKIPCPGCGLTRSKPNDPSLSVTVEAGERAVWHCHHCDWSGSVMPPVRYDRTRRRTEKPRKPDFKPGTVGDDLVGWFKARKISKATIERNRVSLTQAWMPGCKHGETVPTIAFPYTRDGEVVNCKYRGLREKTFRQEKGAEKILYGLNDIADAKQIIIVEGEVDKLSLEEAGFTNVVSVPDGAPQHLKAGAIDPANDAKFDYLRNCEAELAEVERFILAVDNDGPGQVLREELARRLGREKCWYVEWPLINDAPLKDANEILVEQGPEVLRECIDQAQPLPIKGLHTVDEYRGQVLALYHHGREGAFSTGWACLDELYTVRPGELTVVTGIPNHGKSEFVDALMVNLAEKFGWRFAVCSFENPPDEHASKLVEKKLELPFWPGPTSRMSSDELERGLDWVRDRFYFIRVGDDDSATLDWVLEQARAAVLRHGVRGIVIDPYNELEHKRPTNMSETEYVSAALTKVKRFAQANGVHIWFVAHPAKLYRQGEKALPVPGLYDISGSANWANKADCGIAVQRVPESQPPKTEIHVMKIRFKSVGRPGVATLHYDRATGCYSDPGETRRQWYDAS